MPSAFRTYGSSLSAYSKDVRFWNCLEVFFVLWSCFRIYAPEISLLPLALLPTSKDSCLYSLKVQNALESFLSALLPHSSTSHWNCRMPCMGLFSAPALFLVLPWLPALHAPSSPALPSGFGTLPPALPEDLREGEVCGFWFCLRVWLHVIPTCDICLFVAIKSSLKVCFLLILISGKFFLPLLSKRQETSHVSLLFYEGMSFSGIWLI